MKANTLFIAGLLVLVISASGCIEKFLGESSSDSVPSGEITIPSSPLTGLKYVIVKNQTNFTICHYVVDQNGNLITDKSIAAQTFITNIGTELAFISYVVTKGGGFLAAVNAGVEVAIPYLDTLEKEFVKSEGHKKSLKTLRGSLRKINNNPLLSGHYVIFLDALTSASNLSEQTYTANNYDSSAKFINYFGSAVVSTAITSSSRELTAVVTILPLIIPYIDSTIVDEAIAESKGIAGQVPFSDALEKSIKKSIRDDGLLCIGIS